MFGYIDLHPDSLEEARAARYRAWYCGLCRELRSRYGERGRMILANDMTFLCVLLSSLYEPEEKESRGRCAVHPIRERTFVSGPVTRYAADMNVMLMYWKLRDGEWDEKSRVQRHLAQKLRGAWLEAKEAWPRQGGAVEKAMHAIWQLEDEGSSDVDRLCSLSGEMLGALFVLREDVFAPVLWRLGWDLGRFVYLMDAFEDLHEDGKKGRFNPLLPLAGREGREETEQVVLCSLEAMLSDASEQMDLLPLEKDRDLLENVIYRGVWNRYGLMKQAEGRKKEKEGKVEHP